MAQENIGAFSFTEPVVMVHPHLFEPRAFGPKGHENGTPKYSANFLFDPNSADLKEMKSLAAKVARAKWPTRKLSELQFPFSNGDKGADRRQEKSGKDDAKWQRGKVVLVARSRYEPRLSAIINGKLVDYTELAAARTSGKFYFGVEVLAQVTFVSYTGVGQNPDGVNAYLNMVLSTGKGEKLASAGASAATAFAGYIGKLSDYDPRGAAMASVDDETSF